MHKRLDNVMQKEMTRKEFLAALGFGMASILGFSTIIRVLSGHSSVSRHVQGGYGSSPYGR